MTDSQPGVTVTGLQHDLKLKRSIAYVHRDDNSGRRLGLAVPFGCALDDVQAEAEKAVRALASENSRSLRVCKKQIPLAHSIIPSAATRRERQLIGAIGDQARKSIVPQETQETLLPLLLLERQLRRHKDGDSEFQDDGRVL